MPSFRASNFIKNLYAYKGSKPEKVEPQPAKSSMAGVKSSEFNTDFGSAVSSKSKGKITTTSTLAPDLQVANKAASTGLGNNLAYLEQDPTQRFSMMESGDDPVFNLMEIQRNKAENQAAGRMALRAQGTGNLNSTSYGGALGAIDNESQTRRLQNILSTLQYGNETARGNAATQMGAIQGLAGLAYPLASGANNSLFTALNAQDRVALANAQQAFEAEQINTQAMNQYNQANRSALGSVLGSTLGVTGSILAPSFGMAPMTSNPMMSSGGGGGLMSSVGSGGGGNGLSSLSFSDPATVEKLGDFESFLAPVMFA